MTCRTVSRDSGGFTLLELLLAAGITLALTGFLLAITARALAVWREVESRVSAEVQAKVVLDQLAMDLEVARPAVPGDGWLHVHVLRAPSEVVPRGWSLAGNPKPAGPISHRLQGLPPHDDIASARFGLSTALRVLSMRGGAHDDPRDASAPTAVSYQIIRRAAGEEIRYELTRAEVRPVATAAGAGGTFESGYDLTRGDYVQPSRGAGDAGNLSSPPETTILGEHVVDFGLWLLRPDGAGGWNVIFPTDAATEYRPGLAGAWPMACDVMIRLLTSEGVAQLRAFESAGSETSAEVREAEWWALVERHSRVYCRRVLLRGLEP